MIKEAIKISLYEILIEGFGLDCFQTGSCTIDPGAVLGGLVFKWLKRKFISYNKYFLRWVGIKGANANSR